MRRFLQIVALTLGLGLTALWLLGEPLVELLWMRELGLASVFWTVLTTKLLLFVVVFVVAAAFFALNFRALLSRIPPLWATRWASEEGEEPQMGDQPLTRARLRRLAYGLAGLVSLLFASGFATQWDALLRFWHSTPYGQADPHLRARPLLFLARTAVRAGAAERLRRPRLPGAAPARKRLRPPRRNRRAGGQAAPASDRGASPRPQRRPPALGLGVGLLPRPLRAPAGAERRRLWGGLHRDSRHPARTVGHAGRDARLGGAHGIQSRALQLPVARLRAGGVRPHARP